MVCEFHLFEHLFENNVDRASGVNKGSSNIAISFSLTSSGSLCAISIPTMPAIDNVMFSNCSVSSSMALGFYFSEVVVFAGFFLSI